MTLEERAEELTTIIKEGDTYANIEASILSALRYAQAEAYAKAAATARQYLHLAMFAQDPKRWDETEDIAFVIRNLATDGDKP